MLLEENHEYSSRSSLDTTTEKEKERHSPKRYVKSLSIFTVLQQGIQRQHPYWLGNCIPWQKCPILSLR